MGIGVLSDIATKSRSSGPGNALVTALDDGSGKYGEPLVPTLNDRSIRRALRYRCLPSSKPSLVSPAQVRQLQEKECCHRGFLYQSPQR